MLRLIPILVFLAGTMAHAADKPPAVDLTLPQNTLIDYGGFSALTQEVGEHRDQRLVDKNVWLKMAGEPDTLILDTRSKAAFDRGHLDGAMHLNFSDFTEEKLTKVIPSKDTRILIYCNNNFINDVPPIPLKRATLALNIPTFINLYGYGYKNIYELSGVYNMKDPALKFVSSAD